MNNDSDKITIRNFQEGDEEGLFSLWESIHPDSTRSKDEWMAWWNWINKKNPAGEGIVSLAVCNEEIVACHMMLPVWISVNNQPFRVTIGMEAMTRSDFRRKGLFTKTTLKLLDETSDMIASGIGLPNNQSYPAWSRFDGYLTISYPNLLVKPLNWTNVLETKLRNRFIARIVSKVITLLFDRSANKKQRDPDVIKEIHSFDDTVDLLSDNICKKYPIATIRNKDYLNWRYNIPGRPYSIYAVEEDNNIKGYVVLAFRETSDLKVCYIADMIAESEEYMNLLLSKAIEVSKSKKIDFISYNLLADNTYYRVLKNLGFIKYTFSKISHFALYAKPDEKFRELFQDKNNWLFQHGDTDTI